MHILGRVYLILLLVLTATAAWAVEPLVIVVHGIGGGNRADGWSADIAEKYWTDVKEVTFRYDGRSVPNSYADFTNKAGEWAMEVQRRITEEVKNHPGRPVIVVSHSWGTVVTKLALEGGTGDALEVPAINLEGRQIDEWVTLGSPLGRAEAARIAGAMHQLKVEITPGKPRDVRTWTNFYDPNDPVSAARPELEGANNVAVQGGPVWRDVFGIQAHTGIWTDKTVVEHLRKRIRDLDMQMPPRLPAQARKPKPDKGRDNDCMAKHRPRLEELRAHNAAQDPASSSLFTKTMGSNAKCSGAYAACIEAAKTRAKACRPGPDGTFTQCFVAENQDWLRCAAEEIDCCEKALRAQCGNP
ncbi:MAG: hypothetical protein AB1899_12550 [Pseudomonadota bacterium]